MTVKEIRKRAKTLGIEPGRMNKADLIRAIQAAEGNPVCYRSGREYCGELACLWLADCVPGQAAPKPVAEAEAQPDHDPDAVGARTGKWRR
jgi:hypothetical protein